MSIEEFRVWRRRVAKLLEAIEEGQLTLANDSTESLSKSESPLPSRANEHADSSALLKRYKLPALLSPSGQGGKPVTFLSPQQPLSTVKESEASPKSSLGLLRSRSLSELAQPKKHSESVWYRETLGFPEDFAMRWSNEGSPWWRSRDMRVFEAIPGSPKSPAAKNKELEEALLSPPKESPKEISGEKRLVPQRVSSPSGSRILRSPSGASLKKAKPSLARGRPRSSMSTSSEGVTAADVLSVKASVKSNS
jgi:hypothetical protein